MTLKIINYKPIGFNKTNLPSSFYIDDNGLISNNEPDEFKVIDCNNSFLSPGWSDLHVHIWYGGSDVSIRANEAGFKRGVTTLVDAGSAGEATFHGLKEYVIDRQRETIKAFINIGSIGLVACNRIPELIDERFIDIDRTLKVIEENRDIICGIKVRASGVIVGSWGITPVQIARKVAEIANLPMMVHIGEPPPTLNQIFDLLRPGDVVTHCFNGKHPGSISDSPQIFANAKRLAEEGVFMDVGHGAASYNFEVAKEAIDNGLKPYSISTDLHGWNLHGPVYDLATTVSKLYAAGLSLEECVNAITYNPRNFLALDNAASLAAGSKADFTVFNVNDCDELVSDSQGNNITLKSTFEPKMVISGAKTFMAERTKTPQSNS
tara:strand:- start:3258 stop:4394 length:1137 start_codon:yes stop_codon:yes gene_type:complete